MTFAYRVLTFTFKLYSGSFDGGGDTVTITGLRGNAEISRGGITVQASGSVYGLTRSQMNRLSTLGKQYLEGRNAVLIQAGDEGGAMATLYSGPIQEGYADFNASPDVVYRFTAAAGLTEKITPVAPASYGGSVDVANIMSKLAEQMGRTFENNGVSVQITDAYLHGTAWYQAHEVAEAANINWYMDESTLAIWPFGGSRGSSALTLSPSDFVGYPSYTATGIALRAFYNPAFEFGKKITVQSSLTPACGTWSIYQLTHELESETPQGQWFTSLLLNPVGYVVTS